MTRIEYIDQADRTATRLVVIARDDQMQATIRLIYDGTSKRPDASAVRFVIGNNPRVARIFNRSGRIAPMPKTIEELYRVVASTAADAAPPEWRRLEVSATVGSDFAESLYNLIDADGHKKWYEPELLAQYEVNKAFQQMRALMSFQGGQPWNKVCLNIERSGRFHVNYSYDDDKEAS